MTDRKTIYLALFALAATVRWGEGAPEDQKRFLSTSRRVKLFSDVPTDQQPALFQAEHDETSAQRSGLPYRKVYNASWIIYHAVGREPESVPADENNAILDAIFEAIRPKPGDEGFPERNTLGGLVHHAWIEGEIFKDPGDIDDQGLLIVPFKMLVP